MNDSSSLIYEYNPSIEVSYSKEAVKGLSLFGLHEYSVGDSSYAAYINQRDLSLNIMSFDRPNDPPQKIMLNDSLFSVSKNGSISSIALDNNKMAFAQYKQFGIYNLNTHQMEFLKPMEGTDSLPIYYNYRVKAPMNFNDEKGELLIPCSDFRQKGDFMMDLSFQCQVNTQTGYSSTIPVKYPETFEQELGTSAFESFSYKGTDTILYNFSMEDYFLIYDKTKSTTIKVNARSKYHKNIEPLDSTDLQDPDKWSEHFVTSFVYSHILYDKWRKCYYRIYAKNQSLRRDDGYFNTERDKTKGVIVINSDLEIIGEFELPKSNNFNYSVINKGLLFTVPKKDTILDNKINYGAISIKL
ncbi:MAG: DUF4221 family protein [Flavobacteriales bacterium]|nr:DUF4221 family protein [Flavobacteriales bacterium]